MTNKLIVIKTFDNPIQANLAKNCLVDAGIPATLSGENLVGMNWLLSNAAGGIRLLVAADKCTKAKEILESNDGADALEREPDDPDEQEPNATDREKNGERAFRGAIIGVLMPPLQIYVFWLLLRVYLSDDPLRGRHRSRALWAAAINIPIMLVMGTVVRVISARP